MSDQLTHSETKHEIRSVADSFICDDKEMKRGLILLGIINLLAHSAFGAPAEKVADLIQKECRGCTPAFVQKIKGEASACDAGPAEFAAVLKARYELRLEPGGPQRICSALADTLSRAPTDRSIIPPAQVMLLRTSRGQTAF